MKPVPSEISPTRAVLLLFALSITACTDESTGFTAPDPVEPEIVNPRYTALSVGFTSACALDSEGHAYCWQGDPGELGDRNEYSGVPVRVPGGHRWSVIADGTRTRCGVTTEADLYCWKEMPGSDSRLFPTRIHPEREWATVDVSYPYVCAMDIDGTGFCNTTEGTWGGVLTMVPGDESWASLSVGSGHACGITVEGRGYCWGDNYGGAAGAWEHDWLDTLTTAPGASTWKALEAGGDRTCGITAEDVLLCWGANEIGLSELGTLSLDSTHAHDPIRVLDGAPIFEEVFVNDQFGWHGLDFSCARTVATEGHSMICWGDERGVTTISFRPNDWVRIESASDQTCGLTTDGRIFCWPARGSGGRSMVNGDPGVELETALVWPGSEDPLIGDDE